MCRKLFLTMCFGLVLSMTEPASSVCFETIAGYEPAEAGDLEVSPTNPADSPTLDVNWPVLGGVNDVPEATQGDYVLKLSWTNDSKIEIRHLWNKSSFDLAGVSYILVDVYFATESALPAPQKKNIGIWTEWDSNPHWISCEHIPPTTNQWYTVAFYVANLPDYNDVNNITALTFEDMNGTDGIIYIDNLQLATESPYYPYQSPYLGRKIKFSRYWLLIQQSSYPIGAGPNYYTDDSNDVWVDPNGRLHLNIKVKDPNWYCSEVIANENFGYGTYAYTLESNIDQLDPNIILGLFIYDVPKKQGDPREIDVELTKWGDPNDPNNAQFVVQPWQHQGNVYRFNIDYTGDTETTTYVITWKPTRIDFSSYYGDYSPHPRGKDIIDCWSYLGNDIPKPGCENPRINFYLKDGAPPTNGQNAEVVIKSFQYIPLGDLDNDKDVDFFDFALFAEKWLTNIE